VYNVQFYMKAIATYLITLCHINSIFLIF